MEHAMEGRPGLARMRGAGKPSEKELPGVEKEPLGLGSGGPFVARDVVFGLVGLAI